MSKLSLLACALLMSIPLTTFAASTHLDVGTYLLSNHPDGHAAPPLYGLRLDNLFGNGLITTFDFDHPDAAVLLEYDGATVHIHGVAAGAENATGLFELDFTYSVGMGTDASDNTYIDITYGADPANSGTITDLTTNIVYDLEAKADNTGLAFQFGDDEWVDPNGHDMPAGDDPIVGWGWIDYDTRRSNSTGDWLFQATLLPPNPPVPEPGTLALLAFGAAGVAWRRRRQS